MDSLSQFLSSPLLDFTSSTSSNVERPDELDMLLETLSDSDIQLISSTDTNNKQLQTTVESVANVSKDVSCHDMCFSSNHTSATNESTSAFAVTTETDLKRLKDKNMNKNTTRSTAPTHLDKLKSFVLLQVYRFLLS